MAFKGLSYVTGLVGHLRRRGHEESYREYLELKTATSEPPTFPSFDDFARQLFQFRNAAIPPDTQPLECTERLQGHLE